MVIDRRKYFTRIHEIWKKQLESKLALHETLMQRTKDVNPVVHELLKAHQPVKPLKGQELVCDNCEADAITLSLWPCPEWDLIAKTIEEVGLS